MHLLKCALLSTHEGIQSAHLVLVGRPLTHVTAQAVRRLHNHRIPCEKHALYRHYRDMPELVGRSHCPLDLPKIVRRKFLEHFEFPGASEPPRLHVGLPRSIDRWTSSGSPSLLQTTQGYSMVRNRSLFTDRLVSICSKQGSRFGTHAPHHTVDQKGRREQLFGTDVPVVVEGAALIEQAVAPKHSFELP